MGVLPFPQPHTPVPAEKEKEKIDDLIDADLDVRRRELDQLLEADEDTPFNDPWPDYLYK